jgi:hypothetical protein
MACDQTAWDVHCQSMLFVRLSQMTSNSLDTCIIHTPLAYLSDVLDKLNGCTTSLHCGNILPHSDKIVYYTSITVAE